MPQGEVAVPQGAMDYLYMMKSVDEGNIEQASNVTGPVHPRLNLNEAITATQSNGYRQGKANKRMQGA